MKFKEYEKEYEDVYTSENAVSKCDIALIGTDNGWTVSEYKKIFEEEIRRSYMNIFNMIVRYYWLQRRFFYKYKTWKKDKLNYNGYITDNAYSIFLKNYIGINHRVLTGNAFFGKICSYFNDFFKDFDKYSPFENPEKYEFPYKHVTLDFLLLVYQMKERINLLDIAETRKMSFAQFSDYVLNYIFCYNQEYGKDFYSFVNGGHGHYFSYIRNNFGRDSKKADKMKIIKLK